MKQDYELDKVTTELTKLVYEKYHHRMFNACLFFMSGDEELAQDLFQDGWIKIMNHISDFKSEGSFEGWMRRIFKTTSINTRRQKDNIISAKFTEDISKIKNIHHYFQKPFEFDFIGAAITELPLGYKSVFKLYSEGYTHEEIGKIMNISENTSKSQYSRAKERLQQKLKKIA